MEAKPGERQSLSQRMAGAPISWGVCEIPEWGHLLSPERVLAEIAEVGLKATELGPEGFLPADPGALMALLSKYDLGLVGGFVPLRLDDPDLAGAARAVATRAARRLASAGAQVFVTAAFTSVPDLSWRPPISAGQWTHLLSMLAEVQAIARDHGLTHVLHPHVGTVIETDQEVRRVLDHSDVALCLDTGHLTIGGTDPLALAGRIPGRIGLVHLKDVDTRLAGRVRPGALTFVDAVKQGLFRPLGQGAVPISDVVFALEEAGYQGWYVLEQDTALPAEPAEGEGPLRDARSSLVYLREAAAKRPHQTAGGIR